MMYAGVKRYRGEIFNLGGFRNDDALVRNLMVSLWLDDNESYRADNMGRDFVSEDAARRAQRDTEFVPLIINSETGEATVETLKRKPGRPVGAKDKQKRRKPAKVA